MVFDVKVDSIMSSCADHTMLYKSCVKTLRARKKVSGITLPPSRIFPVSTSVDSSKSVSTDVINSHGNHLLEKKAQSLQTAQFFQRARKIHDEISRHKQLLHDHRGRYLGQINDSLSMTQEQCACMDKIISNNLNTVEKQIVDLESRVPASLVQAVKKATSSFTRPGDTGSNGIPASLAAEASDGTNGDVSSSKSKNSDVEWCMAVTVAIVRASLVDLNTIFAAMKQARSHKQSVKAKLMRLQRPSCIEKDSTVRLRQQQQRSKHDSDSDSSHCPGPTNNRKKVQFEDWRDDEDIHLVNGSDKHSDSDSSLHTGAQTNSTKRSSKTFPTTDSDEDTDRKSGTARSRFHDEDPAPSRLDGDQTISYQDSSVFNGSDANLAALSEEECQVLEQENDQLYNELQSTHEEVKQMTKQVAELGRLQDLLTENVEEQAVMADTVQNLVVTATDNVQEGNEQIREAMRKDASFRVWIMFFLIVMSFTILFLDWYND